MADKKINRWSQKVTETSNALDLEAGDILQGRPAKHRVIFEAIRGSQPQAQGQRISVGDVDAEFLYQPRRKQSLQVPSISARSSERRTARPLWKRATRRIITPPACESDSVRTTLAP